MCSDCRKSLSFRGRSAPVGIRLPAPAGAELPLPPSAREVSKPNVLTEGETGGCGHSPLRTVSLRFFRRRRCSRSEASTLGVRRPAHRAAVSFRASDRCHWRGNPFPFSHADRGLFSFSSERKEEKKRRQKLRFWISLRAFACRLSCLSLPRERCAMQISPKCCIVSAPLLAAAFALKCKRTSFYRG